MNLSRAIAIAALAGATVVMATGCSVARKQETVGEYIDGSAVTTAVKAKLANDAGTSASSINVKTIDGGIVQLSGFAKSQAEKDRAGELARSVKGVTEVRNSLIVDFTQHAPGTAPDGRKLDKPYYTAGYDFKLVPAA